MWLFYALFSSILTGCVPILAANPSRRIGAGKTSLIRGAFVLIGSGILVLTSGAKLPLTNFVIWLIFAFSGAFDAIAWYFFYRGISETSTEVAVIQEEICVPLSIILSCLFAMHIPSLTELAAIALFSAAIFYSTRKIHSIYPILSAACTSVQMQLSKIGIEQIGSQESALFLRSVFSMVALLTFSKFSSCSTVKDNYKAFSNISTLLLLSASGICAFFAWQFGFSALAVAPAPQVQAVIKLNFWITGLYYSFKQRSVDRKHWLAYSAMTVGALVLIV